MSKRGKTYQEVSALVDRAKAYEPQEAIELTKSTARAKFDETVEIHMRMGLDPRHADQQVRGLALLPHGTGKQVRVLVFAQGEAATAAQDAGADHVGADDLVKKIEGGWLEFDTAIATPDMMSKIGKLGKILGRRGLMPNPKSGTIAQPADIPKAISEARKGRVEFRLDRTAVIHAVMGKASFQDDQLLENLATFLDSVVKAKPSGAKGQYVKNISMCTTHGPGIKLDLASALALKPE
ncbi:MAG: 50S ribosomal protein L1 [Dehalococcoidia bacterium]